MKKPKKTKRKPKRRVLNRTKTDLLLLEMRLNIAATERENERLRREQW